MLPMWWSEYCNNNTMRKIGQEISTDDAAIFSTSSTGNAVIFKKKTSTGDAAIFKKTSAVDEAIFMRKWVERLWAIKKRKKINDQMTNGITLLLLNKNNAAIEECNLCKSAE